MHWQITSYLHFSQLLELRFSEKKVLKNENHTGRLFFIETNLINNNKKKYRNKIKNVFILTGVCFSLL